MTNNSVLVEPESDYTALEAKQIRMIRFQEAERKFEEATRIHLASAKHYDDDQFEHAHVKELK